MNFSYWEYENWLKNIDFAVIGGGIVGLSSAFHIKIKHPDARVVLIERDFASFGASTRNAGFACYGSPSEIMADLKNQSEQDVFFTMQMRWQGLELLQSYIAPTQMDFYQQHGYEIFLEENQRDWDLVQDQLQMLNVRAKDFLGFEPYSVSENTWGFNGVKGVVKILNEGILNPGKMIRAWQEKCRGVGVELIHGLKIDQLDTVEKAIVVRSRKVHVKNIVVCTNGFANQLLDDLDVIPARNQVLITQPILDQPWNQSFHFREGYVYMRSVENRVLIGGGRDLFRQQESTDEIAVNEKNQQYLLAFLEQLLGKKEIAVSHQWAGIMGMGQSKGPIIKMICPGVYVGVRMGGMGVAIGTWVGKQVAELTL